MLWWIVLNIYGRCEDILDDFEMNSIWVWKWMMYIMLLNYVMWDRDIVFSGGIET